MLDSHLVRDIMDYQGFIQLLQTNAATLPQEQTTTTSVSTLTVIHLFDAIVRYKQARNIIQIPKF